jgi:hypothetical protein
MTFEVMFIFVVGVSYSVASVEPWEVNPISGQDEYETLETFFANIDLSFAEILVRGCLHTCGAGRPPRNPLGLFKAFRPLIFMMSYNLLVSFHITPGIRICT